MTILPGEEKNQLRLFDVDRQKSVAEKEWKGMPEYRIGHHKPVRTIKINFETEEDVQEFSQLIGQKIFPNRENYWFPAWHESLYSDLVYVDSDES